jgi:SAM-dependent methyltransferase
MSSDNTTWETSQERPTAGAWRGQETLPGATPGEVRYGPDIGTETDLRLLGDLRGKRVLELGCGRAGSSIVFAQKGAVAVGVDTSAERLAEARRLAEEAGVRIELRRADLADLAFLRADTIDAVFSASALSHVEDLRRVFRQVHRVLKEGAPLVFSLTHPAYDMIDDDDPEPLVIRRSYFDRSPIAYDRDGAVSEYPRTFSDLFIDLVRTGFRVDVVLEPEPAPGGPRSPEWRETFHMVPRTLILRARKEGV